MELTVQKRDKLGRGVKDLRRHGLVPAELYGRGVPNLHLSVPLKEFRKVLKEAGESTVVNAVLDSQRHPILIQDVSYDPLTDEIRSVDLYEVRMDEKLKVKVPLEFVGVAPAVKEKNGLLVKALQELEVEALPADLPHEIKVEISLLTDIGKSIYVKDLTIPAGVKILVNPETVVATATAKVTEEEELAIQKAASAGVEGVKVETEEAKKERETAKATATPAESTVPTAETSKETPKK